MTIEIATCARCHSTFSRPVFRCSRCGSTEFQSKTSRGEGVVLARTFAGDRRFAAVELDDGITVLAIGGPPAAGASPAPLQIGQRVVVDDLPDGTLQLLDSGACSQESRSTLTACPDGTLQLHDSGAA